MANQQQKRRDAKLAKRRKASKDKLKTVRRQEHASNTAFANMSVDQADQIKHKSIYDIIRDSGELKRRRKAGEQTTDLFTNLELLEGISSMIAMTVKLHSGVVVYLKLVDEKRFELSEEHRDLIEKYERLLVEFTEDVTVVVTLDRAGKQPEDYPEIVLHISDVMHQLMMDYREPILALIETQKDALETYAQEHYQKELGMYAYMEELHEVRMQTVIPLYATGVAQELLNDLNSMAEILDEGEPVDDLDNLPPVDPEDESIVSVQAPQDPVSESQAQ